MAAAITLVVQRWFVSPLFGPLADRLGPRVLLPLGGILVGLLSIGVSAKHRALAVLCDVYSGAGADRVSALRCRALHRGRQLVSCQTAAGHGVGGDGDAIGLGGN